MTYPGRVEEVGGTSFIPIASQRLKLLRDGLEDLEYMYHLEELLGSRDKVAALVGRVVRHAYDFDHDWKTMLSVREAIADAIEATHAA